MGSYEINGHSGRLLSLCVVLKIMGSSGHSPQDHGRHLSIWVALEIVSDLEGFEQSLRL